MNKKHYPQLYTLPLSPLDTGFISITVQESTILKPTISKIHDW